MMDKDERTKKYNAVKKMLAALREKVRKNEIVAEEEIDAAEAAINELAPGILDPMRFWGLKQGLEDIKEYFRGQLANK